MPELPEIYHIAGQMHEALAGKRIAEAEIRQEKCLNMPPEDFKALVTDRPIEQISPRGKWIIVRMAGDAYLMISLGMGGEIAYHPPGAVFPGKYQFLFTFQDESSVHISFWWFGYVHAADAGSLPAHKMTADLGIDPLGDEFTYERLRGMLAGRRGGIKAFLMDQRHIAGIGNVYIQDILFKSGIHPLRRIPDITEDEIRKLHGVIREHLAYAADLGGLMYETDFYGKNGGYEYKLIGHRPGERCPVCGTVIQEIRTGGTRSYVCERCQR